jgi:hypothetical protein
MHLTSLYSIEQLSTALKAKYGADALVKTTEDKNSEGQDIVTVTVVKTFSAKTDKPSEKSEDEQIADVVTVLRAKGVKAWHEGPGFLLVSLGPDICGVFGMNGVFMPDKTWKEMWTGEPQQTSGERVPGLAEGFDMGDLPPGTDPTVVADQIIKAIKERNLWPK